MTPSTSVPPTPDPRAYSEPLLQILAVLECAHLETGDGWLSAVEISHRLRDIWGLQLHWRTIERDLRTERNLVSSRKRSRRWEFLLLAAGRDSLASPRQDITLVDPSRAVQATLSLHTFLQDLKGSIRICDPYVDAVTIEHLDSCRSGVAVRLLSATVRDSGKLRRLIAAFKASGKTLEIRVVGTSVIHDRYIIDDKNMLISGTSLNGFGKKQCFMVFAPPGIRKTTSNSFDSEWGKANRWP